MFLKFFFIYFLILLQSNIDIKKKKKAKDKVLNGHQTGTDGLV